LVTIVYEQRISSIEKNLQLHLKELQKKLARSSLQYVTKLQQEVM
jgi:hypothetical protein